MNRSALASGRAVVLSRIAALSVVLLAGCTLLSPTQPQSFRDGDFTFSEIGNLAYGEQYGQRLDLYLSRSTGVINAPLVVFVYDETLLARSKEKYETVAFRLVEAGYHVAIPEYLNYPVMQFPTFVDNVELAVEYLMSGNTPQWLPSFDSFVLMGHNLGAHTTALLSADASWFSPETRKRLLGHIGVSGPYDLSLETEELQSMYVTALTNTKLIKPINMVTADHPPTLLIQGLKDTRVKPENSQRYARALSAQQVPVTLQLIEDVGFLPLSVQAVALRRSFSSPVLDHAVSFLDSLKR